MHGYTHLYDTNTNKKDYFNYGGRSEFFGHSIENQIEKIKNGLKVFEKNNINIRVFYAPNHTYDKNTFEALKIAGINQVIDGYGLIPYIENEIKFIPQLFYKPILLPFGIQSTQIHLNYWNNDDFNKFEKFVEQNLNKIISYDQALSKVNKSLKISVMNYLVKNILKTKSFF